MNGPQDPAPRGLRALATLAVFGATVLALGNLPKDELPLEWLLAFTVPGAILGAWSRLQQTPWRRALLAIVLQASACWAALELVGPMTRPAALACTILPPLAFATTRNHDADPSLALFLSFCVLLVGIILDGLLMPLLFGYGVLAFLSLHASTLLASHRSTSLRHRPRSKLRPVDVAATSTMALSCLLAMFAIDRSLRCLPSPSSAERQAAANGGGGGRDDGPRSVGLDDSFVLDHDDGRALSNLKGERLVRIAHANDESVPSNMYLRCGFFAEPGLDRWTAGQLDLQKSSRPDGHLIRRPTWGTTLQQIDVERFAGGTKFVFLPPNATAVDGLRELRVDQRREWVREATPSNDYYSVQYEQTREPQPVDPRGADLGMLTLPRGLDRDGLLRLMRAWGVTDDPDQAMRAIADGLDGHCRYERREPVGPFPHTLDNFLFAEGDRYGYCMHFASAAALMLRLQGIPCRIGVGLYGGQPDRSNAMARVYGSQHAHAWVELPLTGGGFYIYDPTPANARGRGFVPDTAPQDTNDDIEAAAMPWYEAWARRFGEWLAQPWPWAVALALALLFAVLPRRQRRPPQPPEPAFARHARRSLGKLLRALAAAGHPRLRGQTLELFARELARRDRLQPEVQRAFATYQEVRFGGRPYDDARHAHMERGVRAAIALRDADRRGDGQDADERATGQS